MFDKKYVKVHIQKIVGLLIIIQTPLICLICSEPIQFAVGFGSLLWMLVLALVMGIEKNVRWGRKIGKPVGFVLLISGLSMLIYSYSKIY